MPNFPEAEDFDPSFNFEPLLAPRDIAPTAFTCWERGGTALLDTSDGIDVQDWFYSCDSVTGVVSVSAPGVVAASTVYTISPLPVQFTGSFDTSMRSVIAWRDVNGDAFVRYWNGAAYTTRTLTAHSRNLVLALDDVRLEFFDFGDTETALAYTRFNSLYVRLDSEDFANEYLIQAGGFPTLFQIGMTTGTQFQFARTGEQMEAATQLNYMRAVNRATKLVGFDSIGQVALSAVVTTGEQGAAGPDIHVEKLVTGSGHTFFLRDADGVWVNSSFQVTLDFYSESGDALRARRVMTFSRDATGNISRVTDSNTGEATILIEEVGAGTRTYTVTVSTREAKQGVTFNVVSVSALPTYGTFTPAWNGSNDFYGGQLVPTGRIAYADYGTYVVLNAYADESYAARSITTSMRWGAGSLPESIRPATPRAVACTVANNGTTVAGVAEFYIDGSARFWPLEVVSTQLVKGSFAKSSHVVRTKGLPSTWQVRFGKISLEGGLLTRITEAGDTRITEDGDTRRI